MLPRSDREPMKGSRERKPPPPLRDVRRLPHMTKAAAMTVTAAMDPTTGAAIHALASDPGIPTTAAPSVAAAGLIELVSMPKGVIVTGAVSPCVADSPVDVMTESTVCVSTDVSGNTAVGVPAMVEKDCARLVVAATAVLVAGAALAAVVTGVALAVTVTGVALTEAVVVGGGGDADVASVVAGVLGSAEEQEEGAIEVGTGD